MKEVIILGCGPTHVECKYHCETWGVNGTYTFVATMPNARLDKLFMTDEESEVNACWYDLVRMSKTNTTLVLPAKYDKFEELGLPLEIFPIEEILKVFQNTRFFSNTIAYMLAYALLHAPENELFRIYLYGIDMTTDSTYIQEKGGVEFWIGIALGMSTERVRRGQPPIEVISPRGSATGKTWNGKMYGYYGSWEEEQLKEKLYAPPEMIRVSKTSNPQEEWMKIGSEYKRVTTQTKAGEEVAKGVGDALILL